MHHPGMIVVLLGLAAVAAEAASKPNILVIFADDMVGLLCAVGCAYIANQWSIFFQLPNLHLSPHSLSLYSPPPPTLRQKLPYT